MVFSSKLPSNSSGNGLEDRQLSKITYINDCLPWDAFKESRCTPLPNKLGSLQSWTKTCYKFVTHHDSQGIPSGSSLHQYRREGYCATDEICVNTYGSPLAGKRGPLIAMCIAKSDYHPPLDRQKSGLKRLLDAVLETIRVPPSPKQPKIDSSDSSGGSGRSSGATVSMSQADGQTPIEADTLKLATWNGADGQEIEPGALQSHKCRDCTDLEVANLASDSDHLKLEARMLTTGAMAGILWIALMSG